MPGGDQAPAVVTNKSSVDSTVAKTPHSGVRINRRRVAIEAAVDRGVRLTLLREAVRQLQQAIRELDWESDGVLA